MNRTKKLLVIVGSVTAMILLILDAGTALQGAKIGIEIVINTIVPTLFPFIYIASIINRTMTGKQVSCMRWLGRICGIPQGSEIILLLGFISGYPIGAKMVNDCCVAGQLERKTARRMLGFCSNAGPSFILGILLPMFSRPIFVFLLWAVHILSAILTAAILPGKSCQSDVNIRRNPGGSFQSLLLKAERTVAEISGLVILFRILIAFLDKYLLYHTPMAIKAIFCGLLELSNGCIILRNVDSEAIRLIVCSFLIAVGGICVFMQTVAVTKSIGTGMYLPGKIIQAAMSYLIITPIALMTYKNVAPTLKNALIAGIPFCILSIAITLILLEKSTRNLKEHSV